MIFKLTSYNRSGILISNDAKIHSPALEELLTEISRRLSHIGDIQETA